MQIVAQIENAMVAALQGAAVASGVRVDIESYGGQLDDDLAEWVRRVPAIWVVFGGAEAPTAVATSKDKWKFRGTFTTFCAQRNLAHNKAQRQGDANNPGVYALMQLTKAALLNKDLALPIKHFAPGRIRTVASVMFNRESAMVYAVDWITEWIEQATAETFAPEGWLNTTALQFFLKPGDDLADMEGTVTHPVV